MALHDPNSRPWWRKIDIPQTRQETALLSETSELLFYRFLLAYTEQRCRLPANVKVLAKVLGTTERRAAEFLRETANTLKSDSAGYLVHQQSRDDFQKAVRESLSQANRRAKRGVSNV